MGFNDLEPWQKETTLESLEPDRSVYFRYTKEALCDGWKEEALRLRECVDKIWDFIKSYPGISQSGVITIKEIIDKAKGNKE